MIGIIGALDIEINEIQKTMKEITEYNYGGRTFFVGKVNSKEVVLVKSMVGKVNASITTVLLLENFDIDYVINLGLAGGIRPLRTFDLVIANKLTYHDFNVSHFGYDYGQVPGFPTEFIMDESLVTRATELAKINGMSNQVGLIATGDKFMISAKLNVKNVIAVEMEGAAIAQVCHIYKKPMVAIRVISDILGVKNQTDNYAKMEEVVARYASIFVLGFLE